MEVIDRECLRVRCTSLPTVLPNLTPVFKNRNPHFAAYNLGNIVASERGQESCFEAPIPFTTQGFDNSVRYLLVQPARTEPISDHP